MHSDPSPEHVPSPPPETLVLILFEGAVRFGREAVAAVAAGERRRGRQLAGRVRAIVEQLERALNPEAGPTARHLAAIYQYVLRRMEPADVDAATLAEVAADLEVLREAWTALVFEHRAESGDAAPALASP
jgi:flagellar protein FliS